MRSALRPKTMNSFLRWAGSKRLILPKLAKYCPSTIKRYVEPFAGSARLFFALEPQRAVLGDLNEELIRTMRAVRRDVDLVLAAVRRLPLGKEAYYEIRRIDPRPLSDAEVAGRFIYLNRYCFNGLFRTNMQGRFNVPYAAPKQGRLLPIAENAIVEAAQLLRRAMLVHGDFETTLAQVRDGDFVYLDPPYAVERRRVFSEYLPGSFSGEDLARLSKCLEGLEERGAYFVISYADSKEARDLLRRWAPKRVHTPRHIAGFAAGRRGAYELIATNVPKEDRA